MLLVLIGLVFGQTHTAAEGAQFDAARARESDGGMEPRAAWVSVELASIRHEPRFDAVVIGLVERNDDVNVTACVPSCDDVEGWAILGPFGALPLKVLTFVQPDGCCAAEAPFIYGKVNRGGARVFLKPSLTSKLIATHPQGHVLAFRPDVGEPGTPWLLLVHGGYVDQSEVVVLTPSAFHGQANPSAAFAFTRRVTELKSAVTGSSQLIDRHAYLALLDASRASLQSADGSISRADAHLGGRRSRPSSVPAGAKWIHIDLSEQVLTAYEGDALVYATLVSTGKSGWSTPRGTFQVWLKVRHGTMEGHRAPYQVEEVPYSMFFNKNVAVHGAAWHDYFGTPVSHGCVNLGPEDAAWLFSWSPPPLPVGWHTIIPQAAGLESLWVVVEKAPQIVDERPILPR